MRRLFLGPSIVTAIGLFSVWFIGGWPAVVTTSILIVLEVTLSFDNAVVNAGVLRDMPRIWQRRFLTWGILIAVFGTRLILPILIVSATALVSPFAVALLAVQDTHAYGALLEEAHYAIAAFGSAFLFLVALKYFLNDAKDFHWIAIVEKRMAKWGNIEAIEIALVLALLVIISAWVPHAATHILAAGVVGVIIFVLMEGVTASAAHHARTLTAGLGGFIYLNILDSAFSLDGVIGAFAITSNLLIIAVGLGIGAYFVRTLTIYLVEEKTLAHLPYLEHGAHWAVFGLAGAMAIGLVVHVPEPVVAGIGLIFIVAAYLSSIRERVHTEVRH